MEISQWMSVWWTTIIQLRLQQMILSHSFIMACCYWLDHVKQKAQSGSQKLVFAVVFLLCVSSVIIGISKNCNVILFKHMPVMWCKATGNTVKHNGILELSLLFEAILNMSAGLAFVDSEVPMSLSFVSIASTKFSSGPSLSGENLFIF